jgi:hypothetical protein
MRVRLELCRLAEQDAQLTCLEASRLTGYSPDHISLMLRRGTIDGQKRGRDWFLGAKSLYNYVQKEPHPGRKRR